MYFKIQPTEKQLGKLLDVLAVFNKHFDIPYFDETADIVVAGGYVLELLLGASVEESTDIDVFINKSRRSLNMSIMYLSSIHETKFSYTIQDFYGAVKKPIQVIPALHTKFCAEVIIDSFDNTASQVCYCFNKHVFLVHPDVLKFMATKDATNCFSVNPQGMSASRKTKYENKFNNYHIYRNWTEDLQLTGSYAELPFQQQDDTNAPLGMRFS